MINQFLLAFIKFQKEYPDVKMTINSFNDVSVSVTVMFKWFCNVDKQQYGFEISFNDEELKLAQFDHSDIIFREFEIAYSNYSIKQKDHLKK